MSNAGQPPEKPTVELEKPPAWAISLSEKVTTGFAGVDARLDGIETTVDNLVSDGKASNLRMTTLEVKFDEYDKRANTNSMRAKQSSEVDLKHEADIAAEKKAREELAAKLADIEKKTDVQTVMLTKAFSLTKDPRVVAVAAFFYFWLRGYAAKHGVELP